MRVRSAAARRSPRARRPDPLTPATREEPPRETPTTYTRSCRSCSSRSAARSAIQPCREPVRPAPPSGRRGPQSGPSARNPTLGRASRDGRTCRAYRSGRETQSGGRGRVQVDAAASTTTARALTGARPPRALRTNPRAVARQSGRAGPHAVVDLRREALAPVRIPHTLDRDAPVRSHTPGQLAPQHDSFDFMTRDADRRDSAKSRRASSSFCAGRARRSPARRPVFLHLQTAAARRRARAGLEEALLTEREVLRHEIVEIRARARDASPDAPSARPSTARSTFGGPSCDSLRRQWPIASISSPEARETRRRRLSAGIAAPWASPSPRDVGGTVGMPRSSSSVVGPAAAARRAVSTLRCRRHRAGRHGARRPAAQADCRAGHVDDGVDGAQLVKCTFASGMPWTRASARPRLEIRARAHAPERPAARARAAARSRGATPVRVEVRVLLVFGSPWLAARNLPAAAVSSAGQLDVDVLRDERPAPHSHAHQAVAGAPAGESAPDRRGAARGRAALRGTCCRRCQEKVSRWSTRPSHVPPDGSFARLRLAARVAAPRRRLLEPVDERRDIGGTERVDVHAVTLRRSSSASRQRGQPAERAP